GPTTFELDGKVGYKLTPGFTLGIESYNAMGPVRSIGQFSTNDQATFLAADTHIGKWDLNLGIGEGYGGNRDSLIVKAVVGVPLGLHLK
ncbi:MAG: hypothetical protein KGJ05_07300, partial [Alphaproteobacteria bacterium]|nr:hypothetical protein [Alphaproteobacteria bacterium]